MSKDGIIYGLFKVAFSYNGSDSYDYLCSVHNSTTAAFETAVNMLKTSVANILIEMNEQTGVAEDENPDPKEQETFEGLIDYYNKISNISDLQELTEFIGDDDFQKTILATRRDSYFYDEEGLHYFGYDDTPVFMQFSIQEMLLEEVEGVSLDSILEAENLISSFKKENKA